MPAIVDYAKDGGPGEHRTLCSFYYDPFRTWNEININKFAISNDKALKSDVYALRSYLRLICKCELTNKKVSATKDHGKNHIQDRPPQVRHLLCNGLLLEL